MLGTPKYGLPNAKKKKPAPVPEESDLAVVDSPEQVDESPHNQPAQIPSYTPVTNKNVVVEHSQVPSDASDNQDDYYFEEISTKPITQPKVSAPAAPPVQSVPHHVEKIEEDYDDLIYTPEANLTPEKPSTTSEPEAQKTSSFMSSFAGGIGSALKNTTKGPFATKGRSAAVVSNEEENKEEESEQSKNLKKGYHPRDNSQPWEPPPGYIWRVRNPNLPDLLTRARLFAFLGIGDPDTYVAPPAPIETDPNETPVEPEIVDVMTLGTEEPETGPRGWQVWYGPRIMHTFTGYEWPTSIFLGAPTQLFYRALHFVFPDTYESVPYKPEAGEIKWHRAWANMKHLAIWMVTSSCTHQIAFNWLLLVPFLLYPRFIFPIRYAKRLVALKRTPHKHWLDLFPGMFNKIPITRRKWPLRWFIISGMVTGIISPVCYDMWGFYEDVPTHDFWEYTIVRPLVGYQSDPKDLLPPPSKAFTPIGSRLLLEKGAETERLKRARQKLRYERFGDDKQQVDDWHELRSEEWQQRRKELFNTKAQQEETLRRFKELKAQSDGKEKL